MLTLILAAALAATPADYCSAAFGAPAGQGLVPQCTSALAQAVKARTVKIDDAQLAACRAAQTPSKPGALLPALPKACAAVLVGTRKAGDVCGSSVECGGGLYCRGLSVAEKGVCAPPVAAGQACELVRDDLSAFTRTVDGPQHRSCDGLCVKGRCLADKKLVN